MAFAALAVATCFLGVGCGKTPPPIYDLVSKDNHPATDEAVRTITGMLPPGWILTKTPAPQETQPASGAKFYLLGRVSGPADASLKEFQLDLSGISKTSRRPPENRDIERIGLLPPDGHKKYLRFLFIVDHARREFWVAPQGGKRNVYQMYGPEKLPE